MFWTSLKLIQWTAGYFEKKGVVNPRLDAELLLAHSLKCPRIDLYTRHDRKIPEKELSRFRTLIERRVQREPLQYIIGETEFYGLKIKVTPNVLIPRPETEVLVEKAVSSAECLGSRKGNSSSRHQTLDSRHCILEIGTGSGCIAIALAKNLSRARIVATDISQEALELARENAGAHAVSDRIEFILADIAPWKRFRAAGTLFDLIVSNPPYIATGDFPELQPEVRDFEPRKTLDGGPDGLAVIRKILNETPPFLKPSALLLLEIGENQAAVLQEILRRSSVLRWKGTHKDLAGHERVAICEKIL